MKRFIFSLEKVLSFKQQTLDIKLNELTALKIKMQDIEKQIKELNEKFDAENAKMAEQMKTGITANTVLIYKTYLTGITDKTKKLQTAHNQMSEVVEQKEKDLIEIKSEISGLEKLKEKQWAQYCKEIQKLQEIAIEEFVNQVRIRA